MHLFFSLLHFLHFGFDSCFNLGRAKNHRTTPALSYVLFPYRISSQTSCSALAAAPALPLDLRCHAVHSSRVQYILQWRPSENSLTVNESRPSHLIEPSSVPVICAFTLSVPCKWVVASAGQQLRPPLTRIRARRCRQCPKNPVLC